MGGKPQLVTRGVAISTQPAYVDDWQWTCGGGCWRTGLGVTSTGRAWLVVAGQTWGGGMTMPVFARVLKQLGAVNAMGFDNNGSTDLFRPLPNDGSCNFAGWCATGYGWERSVPLATSLFYH
jgi:hypothetical protein